MRRYSGGLVGRRSRGAVAPAAALVAAALLAAAAAPAGATITPITHDNAGGLRLPSAAVVAGFPLRSRHGASLPVSRRRTAIRWPSGTLRARCPAFPRTGRRSSCSRPAMRPSADQPTRPGRSRASTTVGTSRIRTGWRQRLRYQRCCSSSSTRPANQLRRLSRLRLPLPVGGVPVAARCRLSTTPSSPRSTTARTWTTSGPSVTAPENFAVVAGRPAGDDRVDGRRSSCRRPRPRARRTGRPRGLLHAQILVPAPATSHRLLCSRSSTTATPSSTAPCSSTTLTLQHPAAERLSERSDLPRSGRGDHRPHYRRHGQHVNADAHRHGRQRRRRCAHSGRPHLQRSRAGRRARADPVGAADRQLLVSAGGAHSRRASTRRRPRRRTLRPTASARPPPSPSRRGPPGAAERRAGARAASRPPAIATTTASRTTRTAPMARCRRSPARRSTRAWSPATSSSSTRRAPGRGRR